MKIEKEMKDYYQSEIERVEIPPCPTAAGRSEFKPIRKGFLPLRIAVAAIIALSFIPLIPGAAQPSVLAVRTAEICRTYELDTRISKGLLDLYKIASKSISTGGKK